MGDQTEQDVEYQLGAHEIDTSGSIVDDDEVVEFDFEPEAVFRRLADDIYTSAEAGIREPLTNAITSVRRVFNNKSETGMIKITVQDGEQVMLRLRDTGEGISKAVLNQVLTVIGRSNAIDDGKLSGQYGMGFLASYKLVGMDGGFLMCTNPRDSEEGPYSGLFKPGTFEPDNDGSLPKILDEDEYGTVFEYYIKDDISISNIRNWVEKHARWSTVPVSYRELDKDGEEVYNEDFHSPSLDWNYDKPSIQFENDYYEAATSPDAESDIVLISSPVSMRSTRNLRRNLPWSVDLRLKYENGVVFRGPNKGLVPIERSQYENMEDARQEKYIPEDGLGDKDMYLPEPTGTRETLRRHRKFLRHVNSQLRTKYLDVVADTLNNFEPDSMSLQDLDDMGRHVMLRIFTDFDDEDKDYSESDVKRTLSKSYDYDSPDEELIEFLLTMTQNVSIISKPKRHNNQYPRKPAYELVDDETRVFMCVSSNSWKVTAVEESDADEHIIKVGSSDEYEPFEEHLNWSPLKTIKKSNATDILEINEETLEEVSTSHKSKSENIDERKITAHYKGGGRDTIRRKVEELREWYEEGSSNPSRSGDVLLLFSKTDGPNISDHYWLADNRCMVATCGRKEQEELMDGSDNIISFTEYLNWVKSKTLMTSNGEMTIGEVLERDGEIVFNLENSKNETIRNREILSGMARQVSKNKGTKLDEDEPLFCLIDKNTWTHLLNNDEEIDEDEIMTLVTSTRVNSYLGDKLYGDEVEIYLESRVPEQIANSVEFKSLVNDADRVNEQVITKSEYLTMAYEDKGTLASQEDTRSEDEFKFPTHTTKDGKKGLDEVYSEYDESNVIIHVLSPDKYRYFEKAQILNAGHDRLSGETLENHEIPSVSSNGIYVPVLESEYEKISDYVDDRTVVLGNWNRYRERTYDVSSNYMYARSMLSQWDNEFVDDIVASNFRTTVSMVETLKPIHDKGIKCPTDIEKEDMMERAKNAI